MHSLAMACVGLVPRPMPEPGLENAGGRGSCQSASSWHDAASSRSYGLQLFAALCCNALSGLRPGVEPSAAWFLRFHAASAK